MKYVSLIYVLTKLTSVVAFRTGFIPFVEMHNVCKRFNVPAKKELLQDLLQKAECNEKGDVKYAQFLKLLNWRDSPGTLNCVSYLQNQKLVGWRLKFQANGTKIHVQTSV